MDDKPGKLGPIGQRVAQNVQDLRERQRLTQGQVVERLAEQGVSMLKTTLSKVENAQRSVTTDELVALAFALRVSPLVLLLSGQGAEYQLSPNDTTKPEWAYEWMVGERLPPLPAADSADELTDQDRAEAWFLFTKALRFVQEPSAHWLVNAELESLRQQGQDREARLQAMVDAAVKRQTESKIQKVLDEFMKSQGYMDLQDSEQAEGGVDDEDR